MKEGTSHEKPLETELVPFCASRMPNELNFGIHGTSQERRGFHFFQFYTWPQLTAVLNSEFWDSLIFQASHANPALRHACIAFGLLGERLHINSVITHDNEDANKKHDFACLQYCKAIRELRKQLRNPNERTVEFTLMICFIFICFEFLQGNESASLTHLKSGLKIIRRSCNDLAPEMNDGVLPTTKSQDFRVNVNQLFTTLDRVASIWLDGPTFEVLGDIPESIVYPPTLISKGFENVTNAYNFLERHQHQLQFIPPAASLQPYCSNLAESPFKSVITLQQELRVNLDNWTLAMEAFLSRDQHKFSTAISYQVQIMKINHRVTSLKLAASCTPNAEDYYSLCDASFDYILSKSTSLLRPINVMLDINVFPTSFGPFSFNEGTVQPLYFTAIHCQDPKLRQKALALLTTPPWREGAWDSAVMARIAKRKLQQRVVEVSECEP